MHIHQPTVFFICEIMYTTRNYHQLWAFYLFIYFFEKEKTIFQSLSDNKDICQHVSQIRR